MLELSRIFIKVVKAGSFSKASLLLNMAPSSISRKIDKLELLLGVTLLNRNTRQLSLTAEGLHFIEGADKLIQDADTLMAALKPSLAEAKGELKISVFESFGRLHLTPILAEFLNTYPKVNITLDLDNKPVDLLSENIDLAVRIGNPADSGLKARLLLKTKMQLCAAPQYLSQYGQPQVPEDLSRHNCLLLDRHRQKNYWQFCKDKQLTKVAVNGNFSTKGGSPLLQAALQGLGIVQLANWMLSDVLAEQKLQLCLPDWQTVVDDQHCGDIYALYKGSKYPNPLLRLLIDFIVEHLPSRLAG
ncbi:LysR family transcriptional regulator [Thalassomonas actiniarum]|uniref:LysR family transcriptional regulator n=1 Tax=Thalassomonas actiniarum TaxID=485447 RepID=A0AAE9YTN5_9GAMM|nr:LysR family transcriptional regulator [Thalassomonas actiniarum]WDE00199.1 LysR family transcriptional regulator [Thalassomonas actiniarum]